MNKPDQILRSWKINSEEWIKLLRDEGIASREFTNKAILHKVDEYKPKKILDLGCGEGWLTRALSQQGYSVTGIDGTEDLIIEARSKGIQNYYHLTYEEIKAGKMVPEAPYDMVIFNFSLYEQDLQELLETLKENLTKDGLIVIQTIHPYFLIQNGLGYRSQWIQDSWKGLRGNFKESHAWYARSLADWLKLFANCRFKIADIYEPTGKENIPVSIIFTIK